VLTKYRPRLIVETTRANLKELIDFLRKYNYHYEVIRGSGFLEPEPGISIFAKPKQ